MSFLITAKQAWGEPLPDWVEALANAADTTSQNKVSALIGKSPSAVSQTIKKAYPGIVKNIEDAVRAKIMNSVRDCPFLGEILVKDCDVYKRQPFPSSGNPTKIGLFKACKQCRFNKSGENADE